MLADIADDNHEVFGEVRLQQAVQPPGNVPQSQLSECYSKHVQFFEQQHTFSFFFPTPATTEQPASDNGIPILNSAISTSPILWACEARTAKISLSLLTPPINATTLAN
jgi:hypothetical protein